MLTASARFSRCALKGKKGTVKARCRMQDITNRVQDTPESDQASTQAKQRLHKLLSGVQSAEAEMLDQMMQELPREELLVLFGQVAGIFVISSLAMTTICGVDPLGGFDFTHPEVHHLLYGIGAAAPLILIDVLLQSDKMPSAVQEYAAREDEQLLIIFRHFSFSDALLVAAVLSVSISFFVFPGLVGCISASAKSCFTYFVSSEGNGHAFEGTLLSVAGLIGVLSGASLSLCPEEAEVVMAAMENSERYYRLTASSGNGSYAARQHSEAFRRASKQLLEDNKHACILASVLTFLKTFYGGMLWKMTGDASVPICLFLCEALMRTIQLKSDRQ